MSRFVFLLLGAWVRLLYNGFRRGKAAVKIGWIIAFLALLVGAGLSGLGGYGLAHLPKLLQEATQSGDLPSTIASITPESLLGSIVSLLVLAIWGIILLSSLGAALNNFYLSSDLDLLVAAPIPMRAIFAAKFLEGLGVGYLLLFALGGPALIGMGIGAGYGWPYFVGAALVLLLLPLVPESIGTLLVMPLVRVIPPRRLREVLQVLGSLVGVAFYFFSQLGQGRNIDPQAAGQALQWLVRLHVPLLPQSWPALGLTGLGAGQYLSAIVALAAFAILSVGLYGLCLVASERLYYGGWANLQSSPAGRKEKERRRPARAERPAGEVGFMPRPILGIVAKDLRLFTRDPQHWTEMLMPLAVFALLLVQGVRNSGPMSAVTGSMTVVFTSAFVFFLAASMSSRLGLGGIGGEGKQIWLLKVSPAPPKRILWGKFWTAYLPYVALSGLMLLALTLVFGRDWRLFLGGWMLVGLLGLGVIGIGVGLGASFPRFDADRKRQGVAAGAGCLYFPIMVIYGGLVVALILLPPLLDNLLRSFSPALAAVLWIIGPLGAAVLTWAALVAPMAMGAERLAGLEV